MLLLVAANQTAHEHHSANQIKHGKEQHEVMSADRAAVASVLLRRKNEEEIQVNCVLFLIRILYRADLSSAEHSGQIPVSEETGGILGARVWEPSAVSVWSGVGCIVERGSEIVSSFDPIAGKVVMTQVQAMASFKNL